MRSLLIALSVAAASVLAACDSGSAQTSGAPVPPPPKSTVAPKSDPYQATAEGTSGFTSGSMMATRTVYVYFDAQCQHCSKLWQTMKGLNTQLKVVWIPVGLLNPASVSQGAAILASADPVATMNEHESALMQGGRGMSAQPPSSAQKALITANTNMLRDIGGQSVPYIVAKHATTGALVTNPGALPEFALRQLLGLPAAAAANP